MLWVIKILTYDTVNCRCEAPFVGPRSLPPKHVKTCRKEARFEGCLLKLVKLRIAIAFAIAKYFAIAIAIVLQLQLHLWLQSRLQLRFWLHSQLRFQSQLFIKGPRNSFANEIKIVCHCNWDCNGICDCNYIRDYDCDAIVFVNVITIDCSIQNLQMPNLKNVIGLEL